MSVQKPVRRSRALFNRRHAFRCVVGAVALTPGLVSCASRQQNSQAPSGAGQAAGSGGQPVSGGTYNGVATDNATLDPQTISKVATDLLAGAVLSRLIRYKSGPDPLTITNHDLENDLAVSAESPDAVTWTFKLRQDAKFQNVAPVNGHAVEAEDIKASFARAIGLPQNPNRGALAMVDVDQIQTPSSDTVVFKLNYPYAPFSKAVASPMYAWILPREALAGSYDPAKVTIGSGPFTLDSATPDVAYVLKKNPNWFESGRPYVSAVNLAVVRDLQTELAQFNSGHLDEVQFGSHDLETMKKANPQATLLQQPPGSVGTAYFPLGDSSSVFLDDRVRQGLSMAIDYDSIGKAVFDGNAVRCLFVTPILGKWALTMDQLDADTSRFYQYNPSEAKKLLDAAGVTGQTFKFAFMNSGVSPAQSWVGPESEAVGNMFQAVGLKLERVPLDFSKDFLDSGKGYRQGYFDKDTIFFFNQQSFNEVDELVYNYFDGKSTQGGEHLKDNTLDDMISRARSIVNEQQRLQAYLDIQKYIAKKVYVLSLGGGYNYFMLQPRVANFNASTPHSEAVETYSKVWLRQ
jgi:peptide/nickel transport system substrate-binding protein